MRVVLVTMLGFVLGCALVLVALYYNPFTAESGVIVSLDAPEGDRKKERRSLTGAPSRTSPLAGGRVSL